MTKVLIETTEDDYHFMAKRQDGRGRMASVPKVELGRLLRDHSRMLKALERTVDVEVQHPPTPGEKRDG